MRILSNSSIFWPPAAKLRRSTHWPAGSTNGRWEFVSMLFMLFTAFQPFVPSPPAHRPPNHRRTGATAVLESLLAALDDTDDNFSSWSCSEDGQSLHQCEARLRCCRLCLVPVLDSKRFPSTFQAHGLSDNRSLVPLKNLWRREHGLPPLPIPDTRKIFQVPAQKLAPLLDRLEQTPSAAVREFSRQCSIAHCHSNIGRDREARSRHPAGTIDRLKSIGRHSPHRPVFNQLAVWLRRLWKFKLGKNRSSRTNR